MRGGAFCRLQWQNVVSPRTPRAWAALLGRGPSGHKVGIFVFSHFCFFFLFSVSKIWNVLKKSEYFLKLNIFKNKHFWTWTFSKFNIFYFEHFLKNKNYNYLLFKKMIKFLIPLTFFESTKFVYFVAHEHFWIG